MVHQEYKSSSTDFTLDIYNLGTPANAFGIYAAESSPDYHFLPIGAQGYGTNEILNFLQNEYYVKLSGFSDKEKAGPALERFAQAVSRRIGSSSSMPEFLSLFPENDLVDHSWKYAKKAPLGHEFLAPAILASYTLGVKQTTLLISKAPDAAAAALKVGSCETISSVRARWSLIRYWRRQPSSGRTSSRARAVFFASGSYAVLCLNPPVNPESFLKTIKERIEEKGAGLSF